MRRFWLFTLAFVLALPLLAAQAPKETKDTKDAAAVPRYDLSTEVTVKGVVTDVKSYQCPISGTVGTHLILKTEAAEPVEVHLGATRFMSDYSFIFKPGDKVTIVGSKVKFEGKDTIIARTLDREDVFMTFRDKNGKPLW